MAVITNLDDRVQLNNDIGNDSGVTKNKKKSKREKVKTKPKKDWVAIVHKGCRIAVFRIIEAVVLFITLSVICILIGNSGIPILAYEMSSGFGLTQSTNIYIAIASWILPMLFYTLLIAAASFCILKKYVKWVHAKFTNIINKPETTKGKDE